MYNLNVKIDKPDDIVLLLKMSGDDYINLILSRGGIFISSMTTDVFLSYNLEVISSSAIEGLDIVRIRKKEFLSLLTSGTMDMFITGTTINIDFKDVTGKYLYSFKSTREEPSISEVSSKLRLLSNAIKAPDVDISNCGILARIARSLSTFIYFNRGKGIVTVPGITIFGEVPFTHNISITGKGLHYILGYGNKVKLLENSVISINGRVKIVLTEINDSHPDDTDVILKTKSLAIAKLSFMNVIELYKLVKPKESNIYLNFENNTIMLEQNGVSFKSDLEVKDIKFSGAYRSISDVLIKEENEAVKTALSGGSEVYNAMEHFGLNGNSNLGIEETNIFTDDLDDMSLDLDLEGIDTSKDSDDFSSFGNEPVNTSSSYVRDIHDSVLKVPFLFLKNVLSAVNMKGPVQMKFAKHYCVVKGLGVYIAFRKEVL